MLVRIVIEDLSMEREERLGGRRRTTISQIILLSRYKNP
jgi:hypothetical protein